MKPLSAAAPLPLRRNRFLRAGVNAVRHRNLTPADALLVSYPKSGNTWLKFMLAHALTGEATTFDSSEALVGTVGVTDSPPLLPSGGRILKSHERYGLGVRAPGLVVQLVRDGRDVAVSYYHHLVRRGASFDSFSAYLRLFTRGRLDGYGRWDEHVASWLDSPHTVDGRLLTLRYEALLEAPEEHLRQAIAFLGVEVDETRVAPSVNASRFDRMRERERSSRFHERQNGQFFVRKGVAGEWREAFDEADLRLFEHSFGETLTRLGYA